VFNKKTKIQFIPESEVYEVLEAYPKPATAFIPKWFKDMPEKVNPSSNNKLLNTGNPNSTVKHCSPFLDSLTSGYIFSLPSDVQISKDFSSVSFPFYLRKDFEGIIKKGTPIAQVIPFKRETWQSEIVPYGNDKNIKHSRDILKSTIDRAYKKNYWSKKKYQ